MNIYIALIFSACVPEFIGNSMPTQPTTDWVDSPSDSGFDTAEPESFVIAPTDAIGFGTGLFCTESTCWITAPYGNESQLFNWNTELELYDTYLPTVGNELDCLGDIPFMNGPDGVYSTDGLVEEAGRVGAVACGETDCLYVTSEGVQSQGSPNTSQHRPKAIALRSDIGIWQNEHGVLVRENGTTSEWSGAEVYSMSENENLLWVGVPNERCIHKFNPTTLEILDSWCSNLHTFGHAIKSISNNAILVGAPGANGGQGYLGFWEDGEEVWNYQGTSGGGFGTNVDIFKNVVLVSEPSSNTGTGQVHGIPWP